MNISRGARYSFMMIGMLVVVTSCQTATGGQQCRTHKLNAENISVAAPGATFLIKNLGSNPAKIVVGADKGTLMTIGGGESSFFVGNTNLKYQVVLTDKSDTTTIEFCTSSSTVSSEDVDRHKGYEAFYSRGDAETALRFWIPLAERGDKCAQSSLGDLYSTGGYNVQQDYKKAVGWYRKSAAEGFYVAQYKLGMMYERGQGVPRDIALSHMWMLIAASQEYPGAVRKVIFNNKNMSPTDIAKAKELAREFEKKKFNGC